MKLLEPPIGIILTMPEIWFKETNHTYKSLSKEFEHYLNEIENGTWHFIKKNLPTKDFLYVYLIWDKKIQYRTNLLMLERNKTKIFTGESGERRSFINKNWIVLCGPAVKAPRDIPMKGFQGFRYVTKELF